MQKVLVLQDVETQKYYNGEYWNMNEYAWTREVKDAKQFNSFKAVEEYIKERQEEEYCDVLEEKMLIVQVIYIIPEKDI